MGIEMEDIDDVEEVVIRTETRDIVIKPAEVSKVTQQGQVSWQVAGKATETPRAGATTEPAGPKFTEEDVSLVAGQANVSREEARKALEATDGQPAEAIIKLLGE
jgi:nascent polypeptide-associated complex subunit alpha